jgi:hypothetical protein
MAGNERLRLMPLVAAIACGVLVAGAAIATSPEGAAQEARVTNLIAQWFGLLESQSSDGAWEVAAFIAEAPLDLSLVETGDRTPMDVVSWLHALRSLHPGVEYRLGELRFDPLEGDLVRVRFEFDRHSVDVAGLPHLARREETWLLRNLPGEAPAVLRIEERRLLAFPGTGPQIVCY